MRMSRTPEIMADAAYAIFHKPAKTFTGHFLIDDTFLYGEGVKRFREVPRAAGRAAGRNLFRARRSTTAARRRDQREKVGLSRFRLSHPKG